MNIWYVLKREKEPFVRSEPSLEIERSLVLYRHTFRRQVPLSSEVKRKRGTCYDVPITSYVITRT